MKFLTKLKLHIKPSVGQVFWIAEPFFSHFKSCKYVGLQQ